MIKSNIRRLSILALALTSIYGLLVLTSSLFLKPYSDEYWMANMVHEYGLIGGFNYWFNNFSSMPVKDIIVYVFCALPAAYLDWTYAMGLSYIIMVSVFGVMSVFVISKVYSVVLGLYQKAAIFFTTIFALTIAPMYSLQVYDILNQNSLDQSVSKYWALANVSWHWNGSVSVYILENALAVLLIALINYKSNLMLKRSYLYAALLGIFIGYMNINSSVAIFGLATVYLIFYKISNKSSFKYRPLHYVAFLTSGALAIYSSTLFEGNIKRSEGMESPLTKLDTLPALAWDGFLEDASYLLSPVYAILPLFVGFIIFYALKYAFNLEPKKAGLSIGLWLMAGGLMSLAVNNALGAIWYKAVWHPMNVQFYTILGCMFIGAYLASVIKPQKAVLALTSISVVFALLFSTAVTSNNKAILERSSGWSEQFNTQVPCIDFDYFLKPREFLKLYAYRPMPAPLKVEALNQATCSNAN